uniref:Uncharacterized protein n=1 Tax=Arundo donax TaxID=35708 RepID=A0A0A9BD59_ARUDO
MIIWCHVMLRKHYVRRKKRQNHLLSDGCQGTRQMEVADSRGFQHSVRIRLLSCFRRLVWL